MTKKERMDAYIEELRQRMYRGQFEPMQVCGNCEHYRRHYVKEKGGFIPLLRGHCVKPRIKNRLEYDVCDNFRFRDSEIGER